MAGEWAVRWPCGERRVSSLRELDRLLDELSRACCGRDAVLAEVVGADRAGTLRIGLGRPLSILSHVPASGDPPYFSSIGDSAAQGAIEFWFCDEWTELPMRHAIPAQTAREACRFFLKHGALPGFIRWEQD